MELNEQDKERIIAEEKLRMETRKEFFKENFGGMGWRGRWGGGWHGYDHCHHHFGFFKVVILGLAIFGLCRLWHGPACGWGPGYYGYPPPASSPAAPAPSPKN